MIIVSWNVNGLRSIVQKDFFESIEKINPDILCLQESKAQEEEVKKSLTTLNKYNIYSNSAHRKGYSGTVILSKEAPDTIVNDMGIPKHDKEGRILCADYRSFYLVNVYVPNSGQRLERLDYRKKWDKDFLNYLKKIESVKPLIVVGDFNVAHHSIDLKNDKSNYNKTAGYTQTEIDGMDNLINSGFVDCFRYLHPDEVTYTYWSYRFKARERNTGWRIDYFLVSQSLVNKVKTIELLSDFYGSDHCPVKLIIDL